MTDRKSVLTNVLGFDPDIEIREDDFFTLFGLYHSFVIKPRSKNRKPRHILAPCDGLKAVQKAIYKKILVHVAPHPAATAFFAGRSIALNARQHLGCRYLYKTDVSDFFPSIKANRIQIVLENHFPHLSQSAMDEVVRLTTYNDALPQGAPTSPHLANLVLYDFDARLSKLCDRIGARYTRYADDIVVSAQDKESLAIVEGEIRSGLAELGLAQHPAKTRFFGPDARKIVTGLDVSGETVRPPRKYRKKTAALVRMCEKYPERATRSNGQRVMGYLLHWQGVSPDDPDLVGLKRRLKKLQFSDAATGDKASRVLAETAIDEIPF